MVVLGQVEGAGGRELGVDRLEPAALEQRVTAGFHHLALGRVAPVDAAAVLAADVAELAVFHRGVDVAPEIVDQLGIAHLGRVVDDAHRLGVADRGIREGILRSLMASRGSRDSLREEVLRARAGGA